MSYEKVLASIEKSINGVLEAQQNVPLGPNNSMRPPEAYILGALKTTLMSLEESKKIVVYAIEAKKAKIKATLDPPPEQPAVTE